MSAYIAYLKFGINNVEYKAVSYNEPIPDFTDKEVYILDFSYPPEDLIKAAATAHSVLMLDHHKSAHLKWLEFTDPTYSAEKEVPYGTFDTSFSNLTVDFNQNQSGAGLTWRHFNFAQSDLSDGLYYPLKAAVEAIEDRDLWKKVIPFTEEICAAMNLVPRDFSEYDRFLTLTSDQEMIAQGVALVAQKKSLCASIAKRATLVSFEGQQVKMVNCNKEHCSEVGHILAQGMPFSITYEIIGGLAVVSLRSTLEGQDVSLIAGKRNGGGHRGAAGFKLPVKEFVELMFLN